MWLSCRNLLTSAGEFLLTHPVWDVTRKPLYRANWQNISTHTSRVGCDYICAQSSKSLAISTHTSRVGCDCHFPPWVQACPNFYSHIPCGMWHTTSMIVMPYLSFLLTHPVWDVTLYGLHGLHNLWHFYSHIPCGMWLHFRRPMHCHRISTHTSRVGCDF